MLTVPHPEVLALDYLPPVALGRNAELAALRGMLGDPYREGRSGGTAQVVGPAGAGTSVVARLAARGVVEALRRVGATPPPVLAAVRVRHCRGAVGVAAQLVRTFDDGFDGHGFPTAELLAGFFRRLRRDARPAVVVLDDVGPSAPDLSVILRGFAHPDRFLPEGQSGMPPMWLVLAGLPEAAGAWAEAGRAGLPDDRRVVLAPYPPGTLRAIVDDRLARALGRPGPGGLSADVAGRAIAEGGSATRALDLLRRSLLGSAGGGPPTAPFGRPRDELALEPRILEALHRALAGGPAALGELRRWDARLAALDGERPLPATTLWRRVLRLESEGLIRREVRMGGEGGTRSTVALVRPFTEWPVRPASRGIRPDVGHVAPGSPRGGGAAWPGRSGGLPMARTPAGSRLPAGDGAR